MCLSQVDAQKIEVTGVIRGDGGERLSGAIIKIKETGEIGASDDEGKYTISAKPNGALIFESMGYESQEIEIKGKRTINVKLKSSAVEIDEVEIVAMVKDKIIPEPTDIEIKGGYFHLKTRFRVPDELYNSHVRLIVQPSIVNLTKKDVAYLTPNVFDGKNFNLNQRRMYGFDISKDPLHDFIIVKNVSGDVINYKDSLLLKDQRDDFRADVVMLIESYGKELYRDSFNIARGTVNPLRFFDYSLYTKDLPIALYPQPEPLQREDKGVVDIQFEVGKKDINLNYANNASEFAKLIERLKSIEDNPIASINSFYIKGYASPEGVYSKNKNLSEERTKAALEYIKNSLKKETVKQLYIEYDSEVQAWEEVAKLMKQDSSEHEQDFSKNIAINLNIDYQSKKVASLPYYKKVIANEYLPKLRKVEYVFTYSLLRELTDQEIIQQYKKDYTALTKNEMWRCYNLLNFKDDTERIAYLKKAKKIYPKEVAFAYLIAQMQNQNGNPDANILKPFINTEAKEEVLLMQITTLFNLYEIKEAQKVANLLPQSSEGIKAILDALNGNYAEAYKYFSRKQDKNNLVLLLALKQNKEAYELSKQIQDESAEMYYIRAIAANRLDKVGEALMFLEQAIMLKPELEAIAKVDGDVLDLLN